MNNYAILSHKILLPLILMLGLIVSCSDATTKNSTSNSFEAINLPDGSIALLNKNSSIEFDEKFRERIVKQTGEVFYVVKKGKTPFRVETKKGNVEVLGTEFNVKSTGEELEVEVEKGSVRMKADQLTKDIKKGQKAILNDIEKKIKVGKAELKHKKWVKNLDKQLQKFRKEFDKSSKKVEKEAKKMGKDIKKELNKLKK